ncbi:penicillin-binding protein 2 [Geobacter sp. DSM 9736]|uniref:penicillin-binding protein 2 n=1 Tax=Geobacter sp. DSM 9736 TaxID=1277350 RepID=UPI000B50D1AD|nr:penicillin-binding protein 2 [Geobacter sp. DSM 9736]
MGLSLAVATALFLLLTRLWFLQVIEVDKMQELSETNRLRLVPVAASRGAILDRNGKVLVNNSPSFSVGVVPQDVKDREGLVDSISGVLDIAREEILAKWEKGKGRAKYFPIIIASNISRDQLEYLEENRLRLPGIEIAMKPVREYPNGQLAAHLLGYLGEISEREMEKEEFSDYKPGDYIGKSGIERSLEQELHGEDGGRQIEVDARGRYLRTLNERPPTIGNSVMLTIDQELQKAIENAFGEKAGAAVMLDVNTGEVLAFASAPTFDPAVFTGKISPEQWKEYLDDKRRPLENKALRGQYPPGSTYKIVTALAGLEEGLIDQHTSVYCNGSYQFGNRKFRCWERKGHGTVNLKKALQMSCDVYFYQLGERLGVDRIAAYARKFNLGKPLNIGLEHEKGGLIPDAAWKEKRFKEKWYRGETLPVAIGQGYTLTTPLQLASMISTVANGGTIYKPFLVKKVLDRDGKVLKEFKPEVAGRAPMNPRNVELVKEGLLAVVNEPRGTGGAARLYEVKVAGKTGTSQVVKLRDSKGGIPYQFRDHALFVAFAPYDKPEVAVAVVVEHGEHGGSAAAPIAGAALRAYFQEKGIIKKPQKPAEEAEADAEDDAAPTEEE